MKEKIVSDFMKGFVLGFVGFSFIVLPIILFFLDTIDSEKALTTSGIGVPLVISLALIFYDKNILDK